MSLFKVLFLSLFVASSAMAKTEVELKSTIETGSALSLQLEDAIVSNKMTAETMRALLNLNLPFKAGTITRTEILNWIKASTHERPELRNFTFRVPEEIQMSSVKGLSRNQVRQRIQNRLLVKCADCIYQVQVTNLPLVLTQDLNLDWKSIPLSGSYMLGLLNSEGQNAGWVSGQIKAQRAVVKAARVLKVGDTLQESDLMTEQADITFIKDFYINKSDLIGKKLARTISMQTMLSSADIQRNYDVRQGQTIKTIAGNESFEISLQTVAQESGVVGDLIRVRNTVNQKMMSARIVDKATVRIE